MVGYNTQQFNINSLISAMAFMVIVVMFFRTVDRMLFPETQKLLPATEGSSEAAKLSTYYTVSFHGDTTFKPGEIVSEQTFKAENERVMKLGLRPARGWVTSKGELRSRGDSRRPPAELVEEYLPAVKQKKNLREFLELPVDEDEILRIHRETGYVP